MYDSRVNARTMTLGRAGWRECGGENTTYWISTWEKQLIEWSLIECRDKEDD